MLSKNIIRIVILVLIFSGVNAFGQEPTTLYYMRTVPQSNLLNPANAPRTNIYVGLPGASTIYSNFQTDLSPKLLFQNSDSGTISLNSKFFDYNKIYNKIGKGIDTRSYTLISPINFGFRSKKAYITFSISEKIKVNCNFPSDLLKLLEKGAPDGSSFDLSYTEMNMQMYQEYAVGYSREIFKDLRVGGRFKILQGFYSFKTDIEDYTLNTSQELWSVRLNANAYTSAPLIVRTDENGIVDSIGFDDNDGALSELDILRNTLSSFANFGVAFDLGATYKLNDYWSFSASIIDLGFIRWKKDVHSFNFNGNFDFRGLEIDSSNIDDIDIAVESLADSMLNSFNGTVGNDKFSTGLGTTLYLGSEFTLNHYFSLGFLSRSVFDRKYYYQDLTFSANVNLYHMFTTSVNYNISFTGEQYAGFGLGIHLSPFQIYLALDNIPLVYANYTLDGKTQFAPYDSRSFNAMVGINLIFGFRGYQDRPKIDAYSEF